MIIIRFSLDFFRIMGYDENRKDRAASILRYGKEQKP